MLANFTSFRRGRSTVAETPVRELPERVRRALPAAFEAVGEALASGHDPRAASAEAGRSVARQGASLGEALAGLRATYSAVLGTEPALAAAEALALSWSEATLEYLHRMTCEDPMTGLASLAHLRTRLDEIYREADTVGGDVRTTHALVVVEVRQPVRPASTLFPMDRALCLAEVANALRTVFSGGESCALLGTDRVVAVARRTERLGAAVAVLRELLADLRLDCEATRVWIEGLPGSADSATSLLDELAR